MAEKTLPIVLTTTALMLVLCLAFVGDFANAAEDDPTVDAKSGSVDKDGQTSGEESKLPANITYEGTMDELIRIHSMRLEPEGSWKFRKFTEEEKTGGALDITGSGKDYVDIEDGNPTPQSPAASINSSKTGLSVDAAFMDDQVDAGDYPLRMEGNLKGGGGDGDGEGGEEKHWAAKVELPVIKGGLIITVIDDVNQVPLPPPNPNPNNRTGREAMVHKLYGNTFPNPAGSVPSDLQVFFDIMTSVQGSLGNQLITRFSQSYPWVDVEPFQLNLNNTTEEERKWLTLLFLKSSLNADPPMTIDMDDAPPDPDEHRMINELRFTYQASTGKFDSFAELRNRQIVGYTPLNDLPGGAGAGIWVRVEFPDGSTSVVPIAAADVVQNLTTAYAGLPNNIKGNVKVSPPTALYGGVSESFVENALYTRAGTSLKKYEDAILQISAPPFFSEVRYEVNGNTVTERHVLGHSPTFTWPSHFVYEWNDNMKRYDRTAIHRRTSVNGPFPGFLEMQFTPNHPDGKPVQSTTHKQSTQHPDYPKYGSY